MGRMIDDEEELKDYGLIEKCSNLVTDENKCLDTWDDENVDYKRCKEINCYKKQLKRLEAENEKLKEKIDSCNDEFGCEELVKYRKALEDIRELGEKTGSMKLIEIIDEVLK